MIKLSIASINKVFLLGLSINRILPFDKLLIFPYIFSLYISGKAKLSSSAFFVICISLFVAIASFLLNLLSANFSIFYPVIFLSAALLLNCAKISPLWIRSIIFINVLFGLIAVCFSLFGFENNYAFSLREKALPFVYAPYGFSPTLQVFGTFCIIFLIISFEYKKNDWKFYVTLLATLLTLNRCTLIFFLLLLFVYVRRFFYVLSGCLLACVAIFWDTIEQILFSTATLSSRKDLRYAAELSFWQSDSWLVFLFGRGSTMTTEKIASRTVMDTTYIENGLDFILHCYGFIGLFLMLSITVFFLFYLVKKEKWHLALISSYYLLFEQMLTHEFLASSFFFFIGTILLLSQKQIH